MLRQRVALELPPVFASGLDDWPGGVRQQYTVLAECPLPDGGTFMSTVLDGASGGVSVAGERSKTVLDLGDAVVEHVSEQAWTVSFPTADTLRTVRQAAEICDRQGTACVLVNPQWSAQGSQVISDFGVGPWAAQAYDFLDSFEPVFVFRKARLEGRQVAVLRAYPGDFEAFVIQSPEDGGDVHLGSFGARDPTFDDLKAALERMFGPISVFERLRMEAEWNAKNVQ